MLATKTVRVNVYDFALFLKEDVMEIYYEDGEISNELDEIVSKFNDGIKKLSDGIMATMRTLIATGHQVPLLL